MCGVGYVEFFGVGGEAHHALGSFAEQFGDHVLVDLDFLVHAVDLVDEDLFD